MTAVSNTLTSIYDKILARGLKKLRGTLVMPQLVNSSYSLEAAKKGQSVEVPRPLTYTTTAVTPGEVPPATTDTDFSHLEIPLDQWFEVDFGMSDKDIAEIDRNKHFMPMGVEAAVDALAEKVNSDVFAKTLHFSSFANNTAAATPAALFASGAGNLAPIGEVTRILAENKVPLANRYAVLDPQRYADILVHESFYRVNEQGRSSERFEGRIGRNFGFDWFYDQQVPTWTYSNNATPGTLTATKGATTITLGGAAAAWNEGDVFTVNTLSKRYVIIDASGSGSDTYVIEPPIEADVTAEALTDVNLHTGSTAVNIPFFHRDAIAFAMRPLSESATLADAMGSQVRTMQDPESGIILRLEVTRQHRQFRWAFDMLWGTRIIRPEMGVRLLAAV